MATLVLKWGSYKDYIGKRSPSKVLLKELERHWAVMDQDNPDLEKQSLLNLIQAWKGNILLDWDDKFISKEDALKYVSEYE